MRIYKIRNVPIFEEKGILCTNTLYFTSNCMERARLTIKLHISNQAEWDGWNPRSRLAEQHMVASALLHSQREAWREWKGQLGEKMYRYLCVFNTESSFNDHIMSLGKTCKDCRLSASSSSDPHQTCYRQFSLITTGLTMTQTMGKYKCNKNCKSKSSCTVGLCFNITAEFTLQKKYYYYCLMMFRTNTTIVFSTFIKEKPLKSQFLINKIKSIRIWNAKRNK